MKVSNQNTNQPTIIAIKLNTMMLERFQSEPRQFQHLKSKLFCKAAVNNKLTIIEVNSLPLVLTLLFR